MNRSWRRFVYTGVFLIYLVQTLGGVAEHSTGWAFWAGVVVLLAFCVTYLASLTTVWAGEGPRFAVLWTIGLALFVAELPLAHESAFTMTVFLSILAIARINLRAIPIIVGFTLLAMFLPPAVGSWHAGVDVDAAFAIPIISLSMYAFFGIMRSNQALTEAQSEVARLAAENERSRIARDLHDLLGHSLTTITVKAGLARRLAEDDPAGAAREITEVEALARRSLADVRAAVASYRDMTLNGELATGRELLRAAGVVPELPPTAVEVPDAQAELFAWALREGLTNVVRHARATRCTVTIGPGFLEVVDDGVGGTPNGSGNGLRGVRERAEAVGGTLTTGRADGGGFRFRVDAANAAPAT